MKITIGYIEEPPFYWTEQDGSVAGADIELAEVVLRAIGYTHIEYQPTTFEELLPGVSSGRWNMNVPLFVTQERSLWVDFSTPVWALGDGFLVAASNPKGLDSYAAIAHRDDAKLAVIADTVQQRSAQSRGVRDTQILQFARQEEAIDALLSGRIDAYAATALGNRAVADRIGSALVAAVAHAVQDRRPAGAFSFGKHDSRLREAVDEQLNRYLGSADHRQRMAKYGFTPEEIDPVLKVR
jgi:polar amino acid transport system substrate-binding protein